MSVDPIALAPPVAPSHRRRLRVVEEMPETGTGAVLAARAGRLATAFTERFGSAPAAIAAAPAVVALLGAPEHGGAALTLAVDRWAVIAVGPGRAVLAESDIPSGAGLASRAAARCALRLARGDVPGDDRTASERVAAAGGISLVDGAAAEPLTVDLHRAGYSLLALDTRLRHLGVDGALAGRGRAIRQAAVALGVPGLAHVAPADLAAAGTALGPVAYRCARHVVTEQERVAAAADALGCRDVRALGRMLTESHASLTRDLRTSTRQVDAVVDAALEAGAAGARMIGTGFGGSVLTLVPLGLEAAVVDAAMTSALRFGYPPPRPLPLTVVEGGRRVR